MKYYFLLATLGAAAFAQSPAPNVPPDTIVATVDGKGIKASDLDLLRATWPGVSQALKSDAASALQSLAFGQYMADEAKKLKLEEKTPWKQQIEMYQQNVLMSAMVTEIRNHIEVSVDDIEAYYKEHVSKYQQYKIKTFVINFKPDVVADPKNLKATPDSFRP